MSYTIDPAVRREAEKLFRAQDLGHVLSSLSNTRLPMDQSGPPPRVHIAVLWLSKGDPAKFEYELENARCDWRDTLVAAGLGNEDWREVLEKRGIDGSDW
jgi:hypothetical protein